MIPHRGILVILLTAFLAACGGQGEPDGDGPPPDTGEAEQAPTPGSAERASEHSPTYSLDQSGQTLIAQTGAEIPIRDNAVNGSVDHWRSDGSTAELSGWAAAVERSEPSEAVVIVRNGEAVASSAPNLHRPDVAEYFEDERLAASGFEIGFPAESGMEVRVYGVAGGVASELPYGEGYPWQVAE